MQRTLNMAYFCLLYGNFFPAESQWYAHCTSPNDVVGSVSLSRSFLSQSNYQLIHHTPASHFPLFSQVSVSPRNISLVRSSPVIRSALSQLNKSWKLGLASTPLYWPFRKAETQRRFPSKARNETRKGGAGSFIFSSPFCQVGSSNFFPPFSNNSWTFGVDQRWQS